LSQPYLSADFSGNVVGTSDGDTIAQWKSQKSEPRERSKPR